MTPHGSAGRNGTSYRNCQCLRSVRCGVDASGGKCPRRQVPAWAIEAASVGMLLEIAKSSWKMRQSVVDAALRMGDRKTVKADVVVARRAARATETEEEARRLAESIKSLTSTAAIERIAHLLEKAEANAFRAQQELARIEEESRNYKAPTVAELSRRRSDCPSYGKRRRIVSAPISCG